MFFWRIPAPNEALIISGAKHHDPSGPQFQVVVGHGAWVLPFRKTARKLSLDEAVSFFEQKDINLVALDEALTNLAKLDSQQSRIVELRFFGGLTIDELAEVLKISPATVSREWAMAKMWLHRELTNA